MVYVRSAVASVLLAVSLGGAYAQTAAAQTPHLFPLTSEQLKQPRFAIAASRAVSGGLLWDKVLGISESGTVTVGKNRYPFTSVADLRTGFYRTIVQLGADKGTFQYGVDAAGGWSQQSGVVKDLHSPAQALRTAMYVQRFGYLRPSDPALYQQAAVDPKVGDQIVVTPQGGSPFLIVIKPATRLVAAIQFAGGELNIFSNYRRTQGLFLPWIVMQGPNLNNLNVFVANAVQVSANEPPAAVLTRPTSAATATGTPAASGTPTPAGTATP